MSNYIQISFRDIQPEQQELLIAHLAEAGYEGFVQGDSFVEENENELKAFIPENSYDKPLLQDLAYKYQLRFSEQVIPEQNWNAAWESNFQPVIVDDFVAVRAGFHEPVKGVEHEIIITPNMSFGTGHHATTYMMVQQMRDIDFTGKKVVDFGTGTGILAILAEKLGAAAVTAIDNDDRSLQNARENIERNDCRKIRLVRANALSSGDRYDVILANISKNVILDNFPSIVHQLSPAGILLVSGLLPEDGPVIQQEAGFVSLRLTKTVQHNNWITLRFNR